jgi:molybdenum cofactor guanylyltransferase
MEAMRSAIILAGGAGSRLGEEKSLIEFDDLPLIRWTARRLGQIVDEVVIVGRDQGQADILRDLLSDLVPRVAFTKDRVPGYGPVAGLAAGMKKARGEYVLAVGCDLPFLNIDVINHLFELARGWDAAVPARKNKMIEPLHAVYRRDVFLEACQNAIDRGDRKIRAPLSMLSINYVNVEGLKVLDQQLLTFFNINTKEDLELARKLWSDSRYAILDKLVDSKH